MACKSTTALKMASWVCRLLLSLVFLLAGISKIIDPSQFVRHVEAFHMTSYRLSVLIAEGLPPLEILSAIALFIRQLSRGGLLLITLMLIITTGALLAAALRHIDLACGCFGNESRGIMLPVIRNCFLLMAVGLTLYVPSFAIVISTGEDGAVRG